ncbi:MAG: hypothetical protein HKM24_04545 [Gammaproteobacteria bacterium]|nr:hypothetical protein [Gammaproteobacteria bacterium]
MKSQAVTGLPAAGHERPSFDSEQQRNAATLYGIVSEDARASRTRRDNAAAGFRNMLVTLSGAAGAIAGIAQTLGWSEGTVLGAIFGISVGGAVLMLIWLLETTTRQMKIKSEDAKLDAIEASGALPVKPRQLASNDFEHRSPLGQWCTITKRSVPLVFFVAFSVTAFVTWPF